MRYDVVITRDIGFCLVSELRRWLKVGLLICLVLGSMRVVM